MPTQQAAGALAADVCPVPSSVTLQADDRASLLAHYCATRAATMEFCARLTPEDMMVQSCAEASPVKWHLAHTSWFFETFVLSEFLPGYTTFHPDFRWLFNSYYNAVGDMPEKKLRASFSRPGSEAILEFRRHVDAGIVQLLESGDVADDAVRRIVLGLHHEQQHLELAATDIKHALFTNPLQPAYLDAPALAEHPTGQRDAPVPLEWVGYTPPAPGVVEVGALPDEADPLAFAFDNETPRHPVYLAPFALANRLVTCAEYLAFVNDNAYGRAELWLSAGWEAVRAEEWQAPLYWRRDAATASGWSVYTLRGWQPLDALLQTPVCHVSLFEADAFARWSSIATPGARLPTEFELEYAMVAAGAEVLARGNFLESGALHPRAGGKTHGHGTGMQQLYGDVWEWTQSAYTGYPGYAPLPGALGEYNGKFMSSQMVLRGGSCVTAVSHLRATYRNFFAPGTRWQFSGLRLARGM